MDLPATCQPVWPGIQGKGGWYLSMMYSQVVNGNLVLVAGRSQAFKVYGVSNDKLTLLGRIPEATGMSYVHFQDP